MPDDPLAALVSRALGVRVEEVAVERVSTSAVADVDRIRWRGDGRSGVLRFARLRREASVEAALLPYLSRRGIPVPAVLASGLPPAHVRESRPWVLTTEVEGPPLAEVATPELRGAALATLEALKRATSGDPTLDALGVPRLPPLRVRDEALAAAELLPPELAERLRALAARLDPSELDADVALVHGDYGGDNLRVFGGKLVVLGWERAHLGSPLEDRARLARDLGETVREDADALRRLAAVRWYGWLARSGWIVREELAHRAREIVDA